jgi:hypothetical protein
MKIFNHTDRTQYAFFLAVLMVLFDLFVCCASHNQTVKDSKIPAFSYQRIAEELGGDTFLIGEDVFLDSENRRRSLCVVNILTSESRINRSDLETFFQWYSSRKDKCISIIMTIYTNPDHIKTAAYANQGFDLDSDSKKANSHIFNAMYSRHVEECDQDKRIYLASENYVYTPNPNDLSFKKKITLK